MKAGKVWLVGAGPGDPGLLTLRGKEVLEQADVVVYDALVSPQILGMIPEGAEGIFAGKRSGHHFLKQEDTNRILLREAAAGKRVVRLKGGDPFLFGRGGEELEFLAENEIPVEIVPGITSALAVPAYQGIPVTHRDYCSSVHIITGHKRKGQTCDIDFSALVKTGGTLVFLMGLAALSDICLGLLRAGMDPETPAAVLARGTTARQERIIASLGSLIECAGKRNMPAPAVIVVGDVCSLAEKLSWYDKRPLAGIRVLITRPGQQSSRLAGMLRQEGAEVLEVPTIALTSRMQEEKPQAAVSSLTSGQYDWLVFTSPSGVMFFMDAFLEAHDVRELASVKIAVIGRGSERELIKYGIRADFVPSVYDGLTLGRELAQRIPENSRILIPRARAGNRELVEELLKREGTELTDLPIYETEYKIREPYFERILTDGGGVDYVMFTSASTVHGFAQAFKGADFEQIRAVCIGRQTSRAARDYGMETLTAESATLKSMLDCLKDEVAKQSG